MNKTCHMGSISVCMIVRNEEAKLPRALASFEPWADEIIVNDTGSTDRTVDIVRACKKARLIQSEWQNDFSAARNLTLREAKSAWIVALDADEFVPESEHPKILALKKRTPDTVYGFVLQDLVDGKPLGGRFVRYWTFPNREDLFFEGKVHEQVMPCVERLGLPCADTDIEVWHTGYEHPAALKQKAKRNLEILLSDASAFRTPYGARELGDCYSVLEDYPQAQAAYQRAFEFPGCATLYPEAYATTPVLIGNMAQKRGDLKGALEWFAKGVALAPQNIEARYRLAAVLQQMGKAAEAKAQYLKVVTQNDNIQVSGNPNLAKLRSFNALFEMEFAARNFAEAERLALDFARAFPDLEMPRKHLARVRFELARTDFESEQYAEALEKLLFGRPYLKHRAEFRLLLGQTLALAGRLGEALEWIREFPDDDDLGELGKILKNMC